MDKLTISKPLGISTNGNGKPEERGKKQWLETPFSLQGIENTNPMGILFMGRNLPSGSVVKTLHFQCRG